MRRRTLLAVLLAALSPSPALAQARSTEALFPLVPEAPFATHGLRFHTSQALLDDLAQAGPTVTMRDVPVPTADGFDAVDLELRRVDVVTDDFRLWVDGKPTLGAADVRAGLTLFAGFVDGEAGSDVYLAFSPTVAFGWISRPSGMVHLMGVDDPRKSWSAGESVLVHESDPALVGARTPFRCATEMPPGYVTPTPGPGTQAATTLVQCTVAVESDYQFYQLFGNLQTASDYALALWGAVSARYQTTVGTALILPYLGVYTTANDPWTTPDVGGSSNDMLEEFRAAWTGRVPGGANLAHFISGANLGGGVAYLDVLCNSAFEFAVSGNLTGKTPFPVQTTSPLNWDFYVTAHETGHNFGSPHTHEFCPVPLDECSPSFGPCQTQQVCGLGTIMSYCHLCPGGLSNIQTDFHPTVAALITSKAQAATCLGTCSDCTQPPLVDFVATGTSGPPPLISTFTTNSAGTVDAWAWDFGDGTTSTTKSTGHVYVYPGTYSVTLTAYWSGGTVVVTKPGLIHVDGGTTAKATERNGSGTNPSIFHTVTLPVLGTTWVATVDAGSIGASGLSFVFGYGRALGPLPTGFGELLIDPTATYYLTALSIVTGGVATHSSPIPNDSSLLGTPVYTQAFLNGPGVLTDAIDLILGT